MFDLPSHFEIFFFLLTRRVRFFRGEQSNDSEVKESEDCKITIENLSNDFCSQKGSKINDVNIDYSPNINCL